MVFDGGYLFTHFCFDFEQVNLEALLYLTCLLLGCCFLCTETGDLFRRHTKNKDTALSPETLVTKRVGRVILSHKCPGLFSNRFLVDFTPLPLEWDATLHFPSQGLAQSQKPVNAHIVMLSSLRLESHCPRLVANKATPRFQRKKVLQPSKILKANVWYLQKFRVNPD